MCHVKFLKNANRGLLLPLVHCSVIYYKLRHKFVKTNNINFDEVFNEDNVKKNHMS